MQEYRATVVEVGAQADDSLLSFCPESDPASCPEVELMSRSDGESAWALAFQPDTRVGATRSVRRRRTSAHRRAGWATSPLLFSSGAVLGAICAIALSAESPKHARGAVVSAQSSSTPPQSRDFAAGAQSALPLPVATTGEATPPVAPSEARPLAQKRIHQGTLLVNSQPRGANIFLNGKYVGQTPMLMRALPAGSRAVRLRLDGYVPWSRGVRIVANEFTTVVAKLNPAKTIG